MTPADAAAARHADHVAAQFGPRADAYVASTVHAAGAGLVRIADLAAASGARRALDLGCGGGHVAFAMAPHVPEVVACDLSQQMLDAVAAEASRRGLANIAVRRGAAEHLPFADAAFDFLGSRFTTHHWTDAAAGFREARRVVRAGARAVFDDVVSPPDALLDSVLQTFEMLRDPSHVRNYSVAEWSRMVEAAGFRIDETATGRMRLDFAAWIARIGTPPLHARAIRSLQTGWSEAVQRHFAIEPDGSFTLDTVIIAATAV